MRIMLLTLLAVVPVLASVTNYDISVSQTNGAWFATPYQDQPAGLLDSSIIWVSQASGSMLEDGSMNAPFKCIDDNVITQSYGKTMFICPGTYVVNSCIDVLSNITIQSLSDNPEDTWLINPTLTWPMFVVTNGCNLYLRGVKITSTNDAGVSGLEGGAIHSSSKFLCEVVNSVFESCQVQDSVGAFSGGWPVSAVDSAVLRSCRLYNCTVDTSTYEEYGLIQDSELYDCIITNCRGTSASYGWGGSIHDCDVYRSKLLGCDGAAYVNNVAAGTWFDVEVKDCCVAGTTYPTFGDNSVPLIMMNVRVSGCQNGAAVMSGIDYDTYPGIMFNCRFENNNNPAVILFGSFSDPVDATGSSGIQSCVFAETNATLEIFNTCEGKVLGSSTNNVFHPIMQITP